LRWRGYERERDGRDEGSEQRDRAAGQGGRILIAARGAPMRRAPLVIPSMKPRT
jgi:hypothetical protein